jgi:hypothetical protein
MPHSQHIDRNFKLGHYRPFVFIDIPASFLHY